MSSNTKVRPTASPRSERMKCQDSTDSDDLLCCTCTNARLAKLLTGICLVQVVTFIAAIATLSVFVRENVSIGIFHFIRITCPCNTCIYTLIPHFYIAKLGYAGVYLFFLFLLQNKDCGYSLEPPRRGGSNVYPQSMF